MNPKIARYHAERKLRLLGVIFVLCSSAFADDTIALQEGMKSLTYKKVGDTELEMKIHYPPDWERWETRASGTWLPAVALMVPVSSRSATSGTDELKLTSTSCSPLVAFAPGANVATACKSRLATA